MKLCMRDKIIITVIGAVILFFIGYKLIFVPTGNKIAELHTEKSQVEGLSSDITPIVEQTNKLKEREKKLIESVDNIKTLDGGLTATNEEFLVFLGDSARQNNVDVIGFNDLGTNELDGIYTATYDFELRGNTVDINKVLEDINNIGIKCSYGSVSFRQNEEFDYLRRFYDDITDLPWYKEPTEDEKKKTEDVPEVPEPPKSVYEPEPVTPSVIIPEPVTPVVPEKVPEKVPETKPEEKPEQKDENINDRLNRLLEQTACHSKYKAVFLTNTVTDNTVYKRTQNMRLAVTVQLIMFNEPSADSSFLIKRSASLDEIL